MNDHEPETHANTSNNVTSDGETPAAVTAPTPTGSNPTANSVPSVSAISPSKVSASSNPPANVTQNQTPSSDLNATHLYQTHNLNLGPNVKHFFVLIPNEAHHGPGDDDGDDDDSRLIDQSFVPSSATIPQGTSVIWLNGDVGHEHTVSLRMMPKTLKILLGT